MAQTLMATGLAPELAYDVAAAVERRLRRRGAAALTLDDLRASPATSSGRERGDVLIERFRQWQTLRLLDRPLIILIGGATGVGKSTLATQLAHRLGITRVIGTDMVRQVMRAFFAAELMPAIHFSSFDAAAAVRVPVPRETDLSSGLHRADQGRLGGHRGAGRRGIEEEQRMVIEGVHLVPGFLDRSRWGEAVVMESGAMAVKERHRGTSRCASGRPAACGRCAGTWSTSREIRRIQKYIVGRARPRGAGRRRAEPGRQPERGARPDSGSRRGGGRAGRRADVRAGAALLPRRRARRRAARRTGLKRFRSGARVRYTR